MKKGIAIVFALGAVVGLGAVVLLKRVKDELELGLNMTPEDLEAPPSHDGCECGCEGECECDGNCECHCAEEDFAPETENP
jgi:hypothetical protein